MGRRTEQQCIFRELRLKRSHGAGAKGGFHDAGAGTRAGEPYAIEDEIVVPRVLTLILDRLDIVQIEMGEAGVDLIMPMIQFDGTESCASGNYAVYLSDFRRFPCFGIPTTETADKAVRIRHVADELHGVLERLAQTRRREEK